MMDFSECFDTTNRSLLLDKLNRYVIRGIVFVLMKSYLTDIWISFTFFRLNSLCTLMAVVLVFYPRGWVIFKDQSAVLFCMIYIPATFLRSVKTVNFFMYANDTCLMFTNDNIEELYREVNVNIEKFSDWCNLKKLSLNPSKRSYTYVIHQQSI